MSEIKAKISSKFGTINSRPKGWKQYVDGSFVIKHKNHRIVEANVKMGLISYVIFVNLSVYN